MRLHGVHTALVTPFNGGELDLAAWEGIVARQVRAGVHGIVVGGTTGESPTLSADEGAALLHDALELARGKCVVTMGVGTNDTRSTVANVVRAKAKGADAGLLVLPYYNKPNRAGLLAHVAAACAPGLPLVVYHVPGRTGQRLSAADLAALCEQDGVVAVKEATGDVAYGQDFMQRCAKPVLSGDDFTWLPLLSVGAAGVVSVLSNVAPRRCVAIYDAFQRGDNATAMKEHAALYPVITYLFAEVNPVPVKALMADMGLCLDEVRPPLAAGSPPDWALNKDLA